MTEREAAPLFFKCCQCGHMNGVIFPRAEITKEKERATTPPSPLKLKTPDISEDEYDQEDYDQEYNDQREVRRDQNTLVIERHSNREREEDEDESESTKKKGSKIITYYNPSTGTEFTVDEDEEYQQPPRQHQDYPSKEWSPWPGENVNAVSAQDRNYQRQEVERYAKQAREQAENRDAAYRSLDRQHTRAEPKQSKPQRREFEEPSVPEASRNKPNIGWNPQERKQTVRANEARTLPTREPPQTRESAEWTPWRGETRSQPQQPSVTRQPPSSPRGHSYHQEGRQAPLHKSSDQGWDPRGKDNERVEAIPRQQTIRRQYYQGFSAEQSRKPESNQPTVVQYTSRSPVHTEPKQPTVVNYTSRAQRVETQNTGKWPTSGSIHSRHAPREQPVDIYHGLREYNSPEKRKAPPSSDVRSKHSRHSDPTPKGTYVPPKRPEYYRTYEENAPKTSNCFYNRKGKETQKESTTMMPSRNSTKSKAPVHSRLGNEKSSNKGRIDGGRKDNRRPPPSRRKKKDFPTEALRHSSPEGELEIDEGFQVTDDFVDLT